jgi:hypothetical protein
VCLLSTFYQLISSTMQTILASVCHKTNFRNTLAFYNGITCKIYSATTTLGTGFMHSDAILVSRDFYSCEMKAICKHSNTPPTVNLPIITTLYL